VQKAHRRYLGLVARELGEGDSGIHSYVTSAVVQLPVAVVASSASMVGGPPAVGALGGGSCMQLENAWPVCVLHWGIHVWVGGPVCACA